jgi:tetratricopeptide (TPR) repeat protein
MDWAGEHGQIDLALHIAGRLLYFWHQRGYNAEGYSRLEALLARGSNASLQARSRALDAFGFLQQQMGAFDAASASLEESARYCEEIGDRPLWCRVILHLGQVAFAAGDIDRGVALTEQSLEAGRKMNDTSHIGRCLNNLGWTLANHGQPERGVPYLEEGLEIARASGSPIDVSSGLDSLGRARLEMGDIEGAETDWREGLAIARDGDFKYPLPYHLDGLAGVAAHRGEAARAARIFAAATRLREETGALLPPGESEPHDRDLERARSLLDGDTWDSAWVEGIAMSLEEAIAYAQDESE